jgi:xanthine dehydrogenase YagT iron-sulfur-binding subunit
MADKDHFCGRAEEEMSLDAPCDWSFSRREFMAGASALLGTSALSRGSVALSGAQRDAQAAAAKQLALSVSINGEQKQVQVDPRMSLLDLLREEMHLTGTKKGCDHGQCGACTVLLDGRRINSCLTLAITCEGSKVTTIEGLARGEQLDPMQEAFLENDGYQCGYCTPGQIISAVALLDEAKRGSASFVTPNLPVMGQLELTDEEIRERMSGNICRCGAYPGIVAAVRQAYGAKTSAAQNKETGVADAAL